MSYPPRQRCRKDDRLRTGGTDARNAGNPRQRPARSSPAGGHHEPHPPHLPFPGQPDQTRRYPRRSPRGHHPGRTARWTTLTPVPAPNRAIATSEPRAGVRPQPPREKLRTRAVPARLPHTSQVRIYCRENPAGFWVSRTGGKTVRRPWRLSCCAVLDRDRCGMTPFES